MALMDGRPRTEFNIIDDSQLGGSFVTGATLVIGETERGRFNSPTLVKNWDDFVTYFGGLPANWKTEKDTDFPIYAKQVLDYGVPLVVSRIEHYSDITNINSGTSTKASALVAGITFDAIQAGDFAASVIISDAVSGLADTFDITLVVDGASRAGATVRDIPKVIGTVEADKIEQALTLIRPQAGTIDMESGVTSTPVLANSTNAAFATFTEVSGAYTIDADSAISEAYSASFTVTKGQKIKLTYANVSGSATGYSVRLVTANDGTGNVVSDTQPLSSGVIIQSLETTTVYISLITTAAAGALGFDTLLQEEVFTSVTTALSGGNYDVTSITDADYIGNSNAGNGIHAFDETEGVRRIAIPHKANNTLDVALEAYVEGRKPEMRAILRVPLGLTNGNAFVQYRNGTGAYAGNTKIDNHLCSMTCGYVYALDPVTNIRTLYSEISQVLAQKGLRELTTLAYRAAAGKDYPLTKTSGVGVNLGTAGKKLEADAVANAGLNPVIVNKTFGNIIGDINTLQVEKSLLSQEQISELMVDIYYNVKAVTDSYLVGGINDIETWQAIYRENFNYFESLIANRAIRAYVYNGDQDATSVTQGVSVNTDLNAIDNGEYKFNIIVYPTSALRYITVNVSVVNGVTAVELGII